MAIPNFSFKYQDSPSTRTAGLGDIKISRDPLVIDFSSTYANNQEAAVSVDSYSVTASQANISGLIGNILITDKTLDDGTFLFYEYQPLYDTATSGFRVIDADGERVRHRVEYAYIDPTDTGRPDREFFLRANVEQDYDVLNGHSEISTPVSTLTFAPFPSPSGSLGYVTHADSLVDGLAQFTEFDGMRMPASGLLDFTFLSATGSLFQESIYADDWAVKVGSGLVALRAGGSTSSNLAISHSTWYRGRLIYTTNKTRLEIYRDTLVGAREIAYTLAPSGFSALCENLFLNHLALYNRVPAFDWELPTVGPRYHHALRWRTSPITGASPFRVRVLTETNDQAFLTYDAVKRDGAIEQNRVEPMNFVPIYKQTVTETNDWTRDGDNLLLSGPLASNSSVYIKPLLEGLISVDVVDNHIVVTNGSFKSSPFSEVTGKYTYQMLEYEALMPFETDNQNIVTPRSLKEVRQRAQVIGAYKIQILPMNVFEGTYPQYVPPITEDIVKTVVNDAVATVSGRVDNLTWRKSRGLKVYVNGVQIEQQAIRGLDMDAGVVHLNTPLVPEDNVEVTYLRRTKYFICDYPRIRPEVVSGTSWRIYLRPTWPNYFLENPTDTLERLAYKTLVNGQPSGSMRSCVSDSVVIETEGTIQLADISMVPVVEFTDARVFGGGLLPDEHFDGEKPRELAHRNSIYYADITRFQTEAPVGLTNLIPWATLFIRIPTTVRAVVEGRFTTQDLALDYIKRTIEKHLAFGTYYMIIDENNQLWDKPFPTIGPRGLDTARIELPS